MTANGRTRSTNRAAIAAAVLLLASVAGSAYAQNFMRSPIGGRPQLSIGPRVNPGIGGAGGNAGGGLDGTAGRAPLHGPATSWTGDGPRSSMPPPHVRDAPRFSSDCDDGTRQCSGRPVAVNGGGKGAARKGRAGGGGSSRAQDVAATRTAPNELVAEIDGALTETQTDALARRHGLRRIVSQNISLLGATIGLFHTDGNRSADAVARDLASDSSVRSVQPNYRYALQDQKPAAGGSDPAQYAQTQLHLPEAHRLARGMNVTIAVIDSGIDAAHPELANTVADTFDALGSKDGPHAHGTAVAGVIAARVRLTGSAPEVRILAIRAFGAAAGGAESTSYVILRSLDYAVAHGAQIVNMSFAGPKDALVARAVAAAAARDVVLVAAAGNAGPEIAATVSRRQSRCDRGRRHRCRRAADGRLEPRQLHRVGGAGRRSPRVGAGRQVPADVRHLLFGRVRQRHRGTGAGAQSGIEARRGAEGPDRHGPRSRDTWT
ncbi:hypothetical protein ACVWY2_009501 [Bradyrhizobium sp. JR6.1]